MPPAELESILLTHPSIADVAVVGIPDEKAGELPKVNVILIILIVLSVILISECYSNYSFGKRIRSRLMDRWIGEIRKN